MAKLAKDGKSVKILEEEKKQQEKKEREKRLNAEI